MCRRPPILAFRPGRSRLRLTSLEAFLTRGEASVGSLITGGGSGAVASSAHAGCSRFRATDPLLVGRTRRALAATLGSPDTGAGIPAARWVRAMAFERLVHDQAFVSELLTRAVGLLEMDRPDAIRVRS